MRGDLTRVRLERAIDQADISQMQQLLEARAKTLIQDAYLVYPNHHGWAEHVPIKHTLWTRALMAPDEQVLCTLVQHNADIKSLAPHLLARQLFELALVVGAPVQTIRYCYALAGHPDLNTLHDDLSRHPVFYALSRGHTHALVWLLSAGMRPSTKISSHPQDPFETLHGWARRFCTQPALQQLVDDARACHALRHHYKTRQHELRGQLMQALQARDAQQVLDALRQGARFGWQLDDQKATDGSDASAHDQAQRLVCSLIQEQQVDILCTLLNYSCMTRSEVLLCALQCNASKSVCVRLVAGFAEVQGTLAQGHSWLHEAVFAGCEGVVQALLERGADPDVLDGHGKTPWQYAQEQGCGSMVQLFEPYTQHPGFGVPPQADAQAQSVVMPLVQAAPEVLDLSAPTTITLFSKNLLEAVKKRATEQESEVRAQTLALHARMSAQAGERQLISASGSERVRALKEDFAIFEEVIDEIADQVMMLERAAHKLQQSIPLKLPNILLVGGAGIGKTHFCNALAQALGLPLQRLDMASTTAVFVISGNSPSWRGAQAGKILENLASGTCANGVLLMDELDKMGARSEGNSYPVEGALFTLLDPRECSKWTDEFIDIPVNASHLNFIASANDLSAIHPAIASRFSIYEIKAPGKQQALKTLRSIYRRALESHPWGVLFDEQPSEQVLEALWQISARTAQQVLLRAFVRAARDGRSTLTVSDLTLPAAKKPSIGFTS